MICTVMDSVLSKKKPLQQKAEHPLTRLSIASIVVLIATTSLLIFSAHLLIHRRCRGIVLMWNCDPGASGDRTEMPLELLANDSLTPLLPTTSSFDFTYRRAQLYEADIIIFDFENSVKYQDDVRDVPKRRGQKWVLRVKSNVNGHFENKLNNSRWRVFPHLPPRLASRIDVIITTIHSK